MKADDLAWILKTRVEAAGGNAYPAVHLFGIEFAEPLADQSLRRICVMAGLSANYGTEVGKGRKLAPFVDVKK